MSEWKDDKEIMLICECGRKHLVQTENTVRIVRPALEAKDKPVVEQLKQED